MTICAGIVALCTSQFPPAHDSDGLLLHSGKLSVVFVVFSIDLVPYIQQNDVFSSFQNLENVMWNELSQMSNQNPQGISKEIWKKSISVFTLRTAANCPSVLSDLLLASSAIFLYLSIWDCWDALVRCRRPRSSSNSLMRDDKPEFASSYRKSFFF